MNLLLVGGFLGSGKTSFILQLAHHMVEELGIPNIAILENEIGELSVDDKLLRGAGYEVRGLFSGCVCCTLAGELPATVLQIERDLHPAWLIMEASGLAFPGSIRETLESALQLPCRICALADAQRWTRLHRAVQELLEGQLESADIILVNKADTVDAETLEAVKTSARAINGAAPVFAISAAAPLPSDLLDTVLEKED